MPEKTMSEKHSMPERTERPERQERPERKSRAEPNVVYVGIKPVMAYVLAVVTQFHTGSKEVTIKARGRSISRAVDTAEVVRHKFMPDLKVKDIRIATEEMDGREGGRVNCSSIEICLGP